MATMLPGPSVLLSPGDLGRRQWALVSVPLLVMFVLFCFVLFFVFSRAAPMAHGGSQARGRIRAVAAGLHHGLRTSDPSHIWDLHHSSWQHQTLNPLSEARDRTHVLIDTSWVHSC